MAIAFVNGGNGNLAAPCSDIATGEVSATTGNAIVVWVATYDTVAYKTVSGIEDTAENTYNLCGSRYQFLYASYYYINVEIWVALNITGNATNVVTASFSACNTGATVMSAQYSGMKTASAYDTGYDPAGNVDGSSPYTTTSDTTAENDECVVGFYAELAFTPETFSDSGSSVVRYQFETADEHCLCIADTAVAVAGAATVAVASDETTTEHFCFAKAFKQAAASARAVMVTRSNPLGVAAGMNFRGRI